MSSENLVEISENLFSIEQVGANIRTDNTLTFEEMTRKLEAYLSKESDDADSTDGVFEFLTTLTDQVQKEFEELLDGNSDKKRFLKVLSKIFTLLLKSTLPEK